MTCVGVTGHQRLKKPTVWKWIQEQIESTLTSIPPPIVGLTSLAVGTDQLFARSVLKIGGAIHVVVPFEGYENQFTGMDRIEFERLRHASIRTETLPRIGSDEQCYLEAGKHVADKSDILLAVWDGRPAKGPGGTADIVKYAMTRAVPIVHLNPITRLVERT